VITPLTRSKDLKRISPSRVWRLL